MRRGSVRGPGPCSEAQKVTHPPGCLVEEEGEEQAAGGGNAQRRCSVPISGREERMALPRAGPCHGAQGSAGPETACPWASCQVTAGTVRPHAAPQPRRQCPVLSARPRLFAEPSSL